MPELPEIETVKLQLQKHLIGETIERIESLSHKTLHGNPKVVVGKKVVGIKRLGKMLVIDVSGNACLAIHFKMSGQLILIRNDKKQVANRIVGGHPTEDYLNPMPSKHTRVIIYLKNGDIIYFNDQRMFGYVKILKDAELRALKFVQSLGKEPWDITDEEFYRLINKRKKAIKLVLMDQTLLSGVGNIYANDGLWEARIHPNTRANELTLTQAKDLRQGVITVLKDGIKYGGATSADAKNIDLDGLGGHYQDHFRTYDRTGEKCLRKDGGVIKKTVLGGRGTYFCPKCQKI